ncbi:hypothetical protein JCM21738_5314 [Mesobacillus boroniphilus JCM 21738]|uniref:Uncharacterized protein n=2 Tax=Mesobacillus boroniphilus TaxID=308892 RepID=W4RVR8_9BACI|nr:hypothetical protein JCM21738_5314 [Mesobacillus boroniphilus JCM 21738]
MWIHKTLKNKVVAYHVYLANANFTNPKTAYQLGQTGTLVYVNQDTARSGWNHIGTVSDYTNSPFFLVINGVMSSKTGSTGADAMKVTY